MGISNLNAFQLDGIREVANIGSGHATTSLSVLLHRKVLMDVPDVFWGKTEDIFNTIVQEDIPSVGILLYFIGDLTGLTLLLISEKEVHNILELVMEKKVEEIGTMEESALKEIASIITGSYMTSLSDFLGVLALPSVPFLKFDTARSIITSALLNIETEEEWTLCIKSSFHIHNGPSITATFFFLPDEAGIYLITSKLQSMLG